jgi:hypothetical protein
VSADRANPNSQPNSKRPQNSEELGMALDALMHPGQKLKPGARVLFEGEA